jgi:hypothetical protein
MGAPADDDAHHVPVEKILSSAFFWLERATMACGVWLERPEGKIHPIVVADPRLKQALDLLDEVWTEYLREWP